MELRHYLDVLKRQKWLLIQSVVVVAVVAAVLSALRTPVYRASASILLKPNDPAEQLATSTSPLPAPPTGPDADRYVLAQEDIVRSDAVAHLAASTVGHITDKQIQNMISVGQVGTSNVLSISATDPDPIRARDVANAVANGYIQDRRQSEVAGLQTAADQIGTELTQLTTTITKLDQQIGNGSTSAGGTSVPTQPVTQPTSGPSQPAGQLTDPTGGVGGVATTQQSLAAARYAAAVQYETLYGRQQDLLVEVSLKSGEAEVISPAQTPTSPASPKPKRDAALGGFVGLLLGGGIVLLREQLDDRLRSPEEIERTTGLPVVAELPQDERSSKDDRVLAAVDFPLSPLSEGVRSLRTSISFLALDEPVKVIVVASARPGEGKSLVAANLAAVYAQSGKRTVLISADLRRPRLAEIFGVHSATGLSNVVANFALVAPISDGSNGAGEVFGGQPASVNSALQPTHLANLSLMPSGPTPPNPAELLGSRRMHEVLAQLRSEHDIVIIDTPPILPVTDAAVLAAHADGTILVTALGHSSRDAVKRATEILAVTGTRVLGVVVNKMPAKTGGYSSYYGEYYGKRDGKSERKRQRRRRGGPSPTRDLTTSPQAAQSEPARVVTAAIGSGVFDQGEGRPVPALVRQVPQGASTPESVVPSPETPAPVAPGAGVAQASRPHSAEDFAGGRGRAATLVRDVTRRGIKRIRAAQSSGRPPTEDRP